MVINQCNAETTAASLAFTFYLLSQHPDAEAQVMREIKQTMGDRLLPTYEDLQKLKYLSLVMKESMRCVVVCILQRVRFDELFVNYENSFCESCKLTFVFVPDLDCTLRSRCKQRG
jgi:hypothetical protein